MVCNICIIEIFGREVGDYVTLGALERLDIQAVVQYLRDEGVLADTNQWQNLRKRCRHYINDCVLGT